MATIKQAIQIQSFANRCGDNILNKNLTFDLPFLANIVSGSGTANTSANMFYSGRRSLYVNNLSSDTTLVVSGGGTNWYNDFSDSYATSVDCIFQFSINNTTGFPLTGRFRIFAFEFEMYTIEFETDSTPTWNTFFQTINLLQEMDFIFELDSVEGQESGVECYLDGVKVEIDDKKTSAPTPYTGYVPTEIEVSQTIDVPNISSNSSEIVTAVVSGAKLGDFVHISYPTSLITSGLLVGTPIVTDDDEVKFIIHNHSGSSVDPSLGVYSFKIVR